jgi:hypothetical protein
MASQAKKAAVSSGIASHLFAQLIVQKLHGISTFTLRKSLLERLNLFTAKLVMSLNHQM